MSARPAEAEISSSASAADVWVSQADAARALDKTTRYVRDLIRDRKLVARYVPRAGKRDELQVSMASIQAFKDRRAAERASGSIAAVNDGAAVRKALAELGTKVEMAISGSAAARPELAISNSAPPPPPIARDWLTLSEASACGLPESYLLALIESGELPARNVGRREGGSWRVKRADVEALGGVRRAR